MAKAGVGTQEEGEGDFSGSLTITGLNGYEDWYVVAITTEIEDEETGFLAVGEQYNSGVENFIKHGFSISGARVDNNGIVVLNYIYQVDMDNNIIIPYTGSAMGHEFDIFISKQPFFSYNDVKDYSNYKGYSIVNFNNGVGTGEFFREDVDNNSGMSGSLTITGLIGIYNQVGKFVVAIPANEYADPFIIALGAAARQTYTDAELSAASFTGAQVDGVGKVILKYLYQVNFDGGMYRFSKYTGNHNGVDFHICVNNSSKFNEDDLDKNIGTLVGVQFENGVGQGVYDGP